MRWADFSIDSIAEVVTKGTTPTTYGMPFTDEGVNFIKAEALNGDAILDSTGFTFISEDTHEKLKRSQLRVNDVLITIAGANVGKCGIVREQHIPANTNQAVGIIRVDPQKASPRFIYYCFKNPRTFAICQGMGGQAAQPNINLTVLKSFVFSGPKNPEGQELISDLIAAYDNLIENNRRRIQLLEESARLLYQEWFVHLRFPGHEQVKITNGVPEGWEPTLLPEVIAVNPRTPIEKGKEIWYVPMSALSETSMTANTADFEQRTKHTNVKFKKNDVLLARITPCLENGKTGYAYFLADDEVACGSTEFIVLRGKRLPSEFVYCLARSYPFRENAIKSMTGSSGRQRVQNSCFDKYPVPLPSGHILDDFVQVVQSNFDQIRNLMAQNAKLAQARDLLLPKLMGGELTV